MNAVEAPDGEECVLEADYRHPAAAKVHGLNHGPLVCDGVVLFGGTQALQTREPASHVDFAWGETAVCCTFYLLRWKVVHCAYCLRGKIFHCVLLMGGVVHCAYCLWEKVAHCAYCLWGK